MEDESRGKIILTVSEFSGILKNVIEDNFYDIKIRGEISGLKTNYASGYYFDIKDESARLKCIIFKNDVRKITFDIKDGLSVTVYGRVSLYEPRGEYSFIVSEIELFGYGELYLIFERLKEKLKKEGLFDESRKRPLPFLPETIGIVTSKSGAVLHDMVKIINERFPGISIIFANSAVQGKNAAAEIAGAIELLNLYGKSSRKIDVIIAGRGGGSIEDLWPFNEEITARAIYASAIPVISAVGHETDWTIADFAADRRASTPSNAAEIVVPVKAELAWQVEKLSDRMRAGIYEVISAVKAEVAMLVKNREKVSPKKQIQDKTIRVYDLSERMRKALNSGINLLKVDVSHLYKRLLLKSPSSILASREYYISVLTDRLKKAAETVINNYSGKLRAENKALNSLSPYNVLKRGYGIVFNRDDTVVSSVSGAGPGEKIKIVLSDGRLAATVDEVSKIV